MNDDLHLSQIQTAWSIVRRAHGDQTAVQSAQRLLLERYGGAIRRYALAALRDEDAAEEVFQEFALKFVRGDLGNADPHRGRFRAFVKTIVYRLIVDHQRRAKDAMRYFAMHSAIANVVARADDDDGEAVFRTSWRDELLARSWEKLAAEEKQSGKPHYTVLRYRADHPELRSPELAAGLGKELGKSTSPGAARVLLHRAREAFAEIMLEEVTESLADGTLDEAEEELIELDLLKYCKPAIDLRRNRLETERE